MKAILISLILLLPLKAIAQSPIPTLQLEDIKANVRILLASEQVRDQAWAAYYIGKFRWAKFTPELEKMLARGDAGLFLHRVTLDALIQMQAIVKAEVLLPHFERFPNQIVILLAPDPVQNESALLSLFEHWQSEARWVAIGNLLVQQRSKRMAITLLRELKIKPIILVVDGQGGGGFGDGFGCGCGGSESSHYFNLPPRVYYELTTQGSAGAVVVASGRRTVFYKRAEQQLDEANYDSCKDCYVSMERDDSRVEYLAELLQVSTRELKISSASSYSIDWKGLLPYQREIRRIKNEVKQTYNCLLEKLIAAELLTQADANDLAPRIELQINDIRKDKSIALPKL